MIKLKKLLFFLITFSAYSAKSELYQTGLPVRCLAMGGTCITQVRGADSILYNSAALARVEGFEMSLVQFSTGITREAENYVDAISNNGSNTLTLADVQELYGKTIAAEVSARGGFAMPYFGVAAYSQNYLVESFSNPTYPTFNVNFISDYGYAVAFAIPVADKTSFGITGRSAKRWGGNSDIDILSLVNSSTDNIIDSNFSDKGTGLALDLSFITTLNSPLKPTFAAVWKDVGTTQYRRYQGANDPPGDSDNLMLGASIEHEFAKFDLVHSIEYKFIRTNNEDISKKIHFGTEASLGPISLRAGINQGYLSYGFGLDLWFIELEAASYSTELGTYAGQSRSERYFVGASISLDFDQSFKLLDSDGKKRRLKQRR